MKTRLTYRQDEYDFKYPAILPGKHSVVQQLISDTHKMFCHAGAGFLVTFLRRKYWILHSRRSVKHVISKCYRCRRLSAKATITEICGLPDDRVKNAEPFEVTGVDLAGPILLKTGKKIWMVLFTCAVYRAVYLDIISSLSTRAFIQSMERFIQKYRRPSIVYSDNGTNFHGAVNLFRKLNWELIQREEGISQIVWKFNPIAAWWGGWWERLIRSAKDLLRRTVGQSTLNRRELEKLVSSVADVMNSRPLTYISDDPMDLEPLTPSLFLRPLGSAQFPEAELVTADNLRCRYNYLSTLKDEVQQRWRKEYVAFLISRPQKPTRNLKVGELVVLRNEKKRNEWPLARIVELIPGKDGISRIAKVKTKDGEFLRPVQKLHPLEMEESGELTGEKAAVRTRSGRAVKTPQRF